MIKTYGFLAYFLVQYLPDMSLYLFQQYPRLHSEAVVCSNQIYTHFFTNHHETRRNDICWSILAEKCIVSIFFGLGQSLF